MARKRRLPYECHYCGKRFKSAQAVRGHLRHCLHRRLGAQAEADGNRQPVPGAIPDPRRGNRRELRHMSDGGSAYRVARRPGPLGKEDRLLLLRVEETMEDFRQRAYDRADMISCLAGMNHPSYTAEMAKRWHAMYQVFDDCLRDLFPMMPLFQLDRVGLRGIYDRIRRLKEHWVSWQANEGRSPERDRLDDETQRILHEDEALFRNLISGLQHLLAASP